MYIQITDHCNMKCIHCGFSCSPRKKRFMTMNNFRKAVKMDDESVVIGGGEPTLHPLFWEILGYAIGHSQYVWLATNGSQTDTAISLARMAEKGVIGCALSLDHYHDEISDRVIEAFKNDKSWSRDDRDLREIRDVFYSVKYAGRAKASGVYTETDGCICDGMIADPDGVLFSCGCKKLVIGRIDSGFNKAGKFMYDYIYRTQLIEGGEKPPVDEDELDGLGITECLFTGSLSKEKKELIRYLKNMEKTR